MKKISNPSSNVDFIISGIKQRAQHIARLKSELISQGFNGFEMIDPFPVLTTRKAVKLNIPDGPTRNLISHSRFVFDNISRFKKYVMIISDDVYIHPELKNHFDDIIAHMEDREIKVVSLFVRPAQAWTDRGFGEENFAIDKNFLWNPAVIYERNFLSKMWLYAESNLCIWSDVLVKGHAKDQGENIYVAMPSLVKHNIGIPSSLGTSKQVGSRLRDTYCYVEKLPKDHFKTFRNND